MIVMKWQVVAAHGEVTLIALVVAFLLWRLSIAVVDRIFARRFIARFIPRVATFRGLAASTAGFIWLVVLALVLLNVWDVNVQPAVWSAGIVTAALAFGAQAIVRDILTGFFLLFEDQFDVGDAIEITTITNAVIKGTVEAMSLRTTSVVDETGRKHVVPNGNILFASNTSRLPARGAVTVSVPLRRNVADLASRVEAAAKANAHAAGIAPESISVSLEAVAADLATFRIEFVSPRADATSAEAKLRAAVVGVLQNDGAYDAAAARPGSG